jgi:hypothetical protein
MGYGKYMLKTLWKKHEGPTTNKNPCELIILVKEHVVTCKLLV